VGESGERGGLNRRMVGKIVVGVDGGGDEWTFLLTSVRGRLKLARKGRGEEVKHLSLSDAARERGKHPFL